MKYLILVATVLMMALAAVPSPVQAQHLPQPFCPAGQVFSCIRVDGFFTCGCR